MAIGIAPARPPYVEFKQVAVEDRNASIESGRRVTKNVNMAFVMQPGSRDSTEKIAEEWIAQLRKKYVIKAPDAYPEAWIDQIQAKFDSWKRGVEAPTDGTSLKEAPFLSPADVQNLFAVKIFTVEDLAAATEEALGRIGMGGRILRDKARQFCSAKSAAEIELESMRARITELEALLEDAPKKRGRPPKED